MATCAAFGLAMYLGIEFIGINLAAPFLMISKCNELMWIIIIKKRMKWNEIKRKNKKKIQSCQCEKLCKLKW